MKAALTAARNLAAARAADHPVPSREQLEAKADLGTVRAQTDALLATYMAKAGVDVGPFDQLQAQAAAAGERLGKAHLAAAAARSASAVHGIRQAIKARRDALGELTAADPTQYVALDTPFLIWPTNGVDLEDSAAVAWNSWAKFQLYIRNSGGSQQTGQEEVGFYFLWENPRDTTAYVDIDGYLVLNGMCSAVANGGTFPGDRFARARTDATLRIFEWWNQPPTHPLPQVDQVQRFSTIDLDAGGWFDYQKSQFDDFFRGFDLRYELMAIPPHATVVLEVTCTMAYEVEEGLIFHYFMFEDNAVICPFVQIRIRP